MAEVKKTKIDQVIEKYIAEIERLIREYESEKINPLRKRIEDLKRTHAKQEAIDNVQAEFNDATKKLNHLKNVLKMLKDPDLIKNLNDKFLSLNKELIELRGNPIDIKKLAEEVAATKIEEAVKKAVEEALNNAKATTDEIIKELNKKIDESAKKIEDLETQLEKLQQELDSSNIEGFGEQFRAEEAEAKVVDLETQLNDAKLQLQEVEQKLKSASGNETSLQSEKTELEEKIKTLEEEIISLKGYLSFANQFIDSLQDELNDMTIDYTQEALKARLLEEKNSQLDQKITELGATLQRWKGSVANIAEKIGLSRKSNTGVIAKRINRLLQAKEGLDDLLTKSNVKTVDELNNLINELSEDKTRLETIMRELGIPDVDHIDVRIAMLQSIENACDIFADKFKLDESSIAGLTEEEVEKLIAKKIEDYALEYVNGQLYAENPEIQFNSIEEIEQAYNDAVKYKKVMNEAITKVFSEISVDATPAEVYAKLQEVASKMQDLEKDLNQAIQDKQDLNDVITNLTDEQKQLLILLGVTEVVDDDKVIERIVAEINKLQNDFTQEQNNNRDLNDKITNLTDEQKKLLRDTLGISEAVADDKVMERVIAEINQLQNDLNQAIQDKQDLNDVITNLTDEQKQLLILLGVTESVADDQVILRITNEITRLQDDLADFAGVVKPVAYATLWDEIKTKINDCKDNKSFEDSDKQYLEERLRIIYNDKTKNSAGTEILDTAQKLFTLQKDVVAARKCKGLTADEKEALKKLEAFIELHATKLESKDILDKKDKLTWVDKIKNRAPIMKNKLFVSIVAVSLVVVIVGTAIFTALFNRHKDDQEQEGYKLGITAGMVDGKAGEDKDYTDEAEYNDGCKHFKKGFAEGYEKGYEEGEKFRKPIDVPDPPVDTRPENLLVNADELASIVGATGSSTYREFANNIIDGFNVAEIKAIEKVSVDGTSVIVEIDYVDLDGNELSVQKTVQVKEGAELTPENIITALKQNASESKKDTENSGQTTEDVTPEAIEGVKNVEVSEEEGVVMIETESGEIIEIDYTDVESYAIYKKQCARKGIDLDKVFKANGIVIDTDIENE